MEEQVNIPALYYVWFLVRIFESVACFEYTRGASRRQSLRAKSIIEDGVPRKAKNR